MVPRVPHLIAAFGVLVACGAWPEYGGDGLTGIAGTTNVAREIPHGRPARYGYEVVNAFPHDHQAFTQGLVFLDGTFYESTGLYGPSSIRRVDVATGGVLATRPVPSKYFAEGMTVLNDEVFQLTYKEHTCFVYARQDFAPLRTFRYTGEGWGLTHDGKHLVMSDGTSVLRFLDPKSFAEVRTLAVTDLGRAVPKLNELEWVEGEIYANIWGEDQIARIDPVSGKVLGWIDLTGILRSADAVDVDVMNGIAYDAEGKRLFVTGKLWPKLFEIRLVASQ